MKSARRERGPSTTIDYYYYCRNGRSSKENIQFMPKISGRPLSLMESNLVLDKIVKNSLIDRTGSARIEGLRIGASYSAKPIEQTFGLKRLLSNLFPTFRVAGQSQINQTNLRLRSASSSQLEDFLSKLLWLKKSFGAHTSKEQNRNSAAERFGVAFPNSEFDLAPFKG